jgi:hypothetical protein
VSGLGFDGGEHAEAGVQAPVVEPVDPGHGRELDVAEVLERAGVEGAGRMASVLNKPMIVSIRLLS